MYLLTRLLHVAPFLQGLLLHSLISEEIEELNLGFVKLIYSNLSKTYNKLEYKACFRSCQLHTRASRELERKGGTNSLQCQSLIRSSSLPLSYLSSSEMFRWLSLISSFIHVVLSASSSLAAMALQKFFDKTRIKSTIIFIHSLNKQTEISVYLIMM